MSPSGVQYWNFAIDLIPSKYRDSVAEISDYDFG